MPDTDIDVIDHQILESLERHGRATLDEIGKIVGLSGSAVKRRISRLESAEVIVGYTTIIDRTKLGWALQAFVELRFAGDSRVDAIANVGQDIPEISEVITIAGDPDAIAHINVRNVGHLKTVIDQLRTSPGLVGTKTMMVLGRSRRTSLRT